MLRQAADDIARQAVRQTTRKDVRRLTTMARIFVEKNAMAGGTYEELAESVNHALADLAAFQAKEGNNG